MRTRDLITYPTIVSALGGAQWVEVGKRYAWVTTARGERVRLTLSKMKPRAKWTAFNLADAAARAAR